jgi:hypothetical protein
MERLLHVHVVGGMTTLGVLVFPEDPDRVVGAD